MVNPDLENIIDAAKILFKVKFPAVLATVDAGKAEPLSPQPPIQWFFGDVKNVPQMPSMLFTGHETKEEEDEYDWRRQRYTLEIEAYYSYPDIQKLSRIVRRYGAAIDQTLRENLTLDGVVSEMTNIRQKYWDSVSSKTALMQAVNVSFDVIVMTN